jgi:hypothetical protein
MDIATILVQEPQWASQVACLAQGVAVRGGARDEFHFATYPPQNMK